MKSIPILFAIAGITLMVWEIWSLIFIRRVLKTGRLSQQWRQGRMMSFVIGTLLVVTIPWQHYPLGEGTAAGVPFLAAWFDANGRDFIGAVTLPALLGDVVVWFLVPQLVLAYLARRHLVSLQAKPSQS
jgi:hypothetical protein